jgi:transposase
VHLVVDALGLPLAFEVTEGQRHDIVPAAGLVQRTRPRRLLADKAYSTHEFRTLLDRLTCQPVIPSSSSWIDPPSYDKELYKARAEVECTFSLLKQARRFATRYEKTLRNYAAVVAIGCALLWLRIWPDEPTSQVAHLRQHRDHPFEQLDAPPIAIGVDERHRGHHVEMRRRLHRRAAGNEVVMPSIGSSATAGSFGDVRHRRLCR